MTEKILIKTYIENSIVSFPFLDVRVLNPPCKIINDNKLQEGCVDEAHADGVPQVHGCQI